MKRKDIVEKKLERATDLSLTEKAMLLFDHDLYMAAIDKGTNLQKKYIAYIRNICNYLLDSHQCDQIFEIDPSLEHFANCIEDVIFSDIRLIQNQISDKVLENIIGG